MKVLALYVPVLHEGYLRLLKKYMAAAEVCYIFAPDLIKRFTKVHGEIRAITPAQAQRLITGIGFFKKVELLTAAKAKKLNATGTTVITADEELSRQVAATFFPKARIVFDTIFLRWDERSVRADKQPTNVRTTTNAFDQKMMVRASGLATHSSDWWRHVGALIVKNKKVVLERFNTHVPTRQTQYIHGDPRDFFPAGVQPEVATSLHCEQGLITDAARKGISLKGASLYTTVFPCAMCAKQVAYSGITTVYYASGHAVLDGESIMKAQGIELVFVKMPKAAAK